MMGKCLICGKSENYANIYGCNLCKDCYQMLDMWETAECAFEEWKSSIENYRSQEEGVDYVVKEILAGIEQELCLQEQKQEVLKRLKEKIHLHLQYYSNSEVHIAILMVRELVRRLLLKNREKCGWEVISDLSASNLLLRVADDISEVEYENNPMGSLEQGASNFITALCLARRYNLIEENCNLTQNENVCIEDICYEAFETSETNKFFPKYLLNGVSEKAEDYIIRNKALKDKLEREAKTPEYILRDLDGLLKKEFGFERKDYKDLCRRLLRYEFSTRNDYENYFESDKLFINMPLIVLKKTTLEDICGCETLEALLNAFSINRAIGECRKDEELELFSFYENGEFIVVGNFDFLQNISAFEKFILSKDYIDIFKISNEFSKALTKTQKKMSKYIAISAADYLFLNGYKLPMEKYDSQWIPRAEIDKIKIGGKQVLSSCGDIDVLALDTERKIVLLFEIKYYKPAITSFEMLYKDKSKIDEDEVIRKMENRERVVLENLDEIVKYVLGDYEYGYEVKSIFLTPRANYYAVNENKLNYLTWAEFMEKAKCKNL